MICKNNNAEVATMTLHYLSHPLYFLTEGTQGCAILCVLVFRHRILSRRPEPSCIFLDLCSDFFILIYVFSPTLFTTQSFGRFPIEGVS